MSHDGSAGVHVERTLMEKSGSLYFVPVHGWRVHANELMRSADANLRQNVLSANSSLRDMLLLDHALVHQQHHLVRDTLSNWKPVHIMQKQCHEQSKND